MNRAEHFLFLLAAVAFVATVSGTLPPVSVPPAAGFFEAEVAAVVGDSLGLHRAILLVPKKRIENTKALVLMVGGTEGTAIATTLAHRSYPRPLTHDLVMELADSLGGHIRGLYIHSLQNETYFARLEVGQGRKVLSFDCRPSDGIALALKARVPIWINSRLFEEAAVELPGPGGEDDEGGPREEKENRGGGI